MSLSNGDLSAADVAAVVGNGNNGFGWNDGGSFWIIVLFIFAIMNGGWGNGFGGNNSSTPYIVNDMQNGFDQAAVMSGINGITAALANAEVSRCNTLANLTGQINALGLNQATNDCNTRASIADLKYTIATESCNTRQANSENTQALLNTINSGIQSIQDKLCQQEIDALKTANANLQTQINMANLRASQSEQTAAVLADNAKQTMALEQYLNPAPIPAYVVQNPNCCGQYGYGYGCGN